jgi:DNA-binding protein Alba
MATTPTISSPETPRYPHVYIGRKPFRVYLEAVRSELQREGGVIIAARGDLISRAVLAAMKNLYPPYIPSTTIGATSLKGQDGRDREVPTIEILLYRPIRPVANYPPVLLQHPESG